MRVPWKAIGLAGVAGVAATGVVVQQRRRAHVEYDPDALREKLHARLDDARSADPGPDLGGDPAARPAPGASA